jgi:hypothetical protein
MKSSRFSEEQIIGMLKEQEAGAKTADICPKSGTQQIVGHSNINPSLPRLFAQRLLCGVPDGSHDS